MKEKWKHYFAWLKKTTVESTADGVFMTSEEIDQSATLHTENERLTTELQTAKEAETKAGEELATANTDNAQAVTDAVALATKPLNEQIETLKAENQTAVTAQLDAETKLAKVTGKGTVAPGASDANIDGNKGKLTKNGKAADANAKSLMGDESDDDESDGVTGE